MKTKRMIVGFFTRLSLRHVAVVLTIVGSLAAASLTVAAVAGASGSKVTQPIKAFLGMRNTKTAAPVEAPTTSQNAAVSRARVSELEDGRIVVSMDSGDDLKGLVSLWIVKGSGGSTVTGGDWSLVHSYSEEVEGGSNPEHSEGEVFINKGTLGGHITGGSITYNADGSIASLNGLQLNLTSGSLTYEGAQGSGTLNVTQVSDSPNSTGTISLSF